MADVPVYRCRCGEVLFDRRDADMHVGHDAHRGDHAYSAVAACERCGGSLGDHAIVHLGGVYCGSMCAHRAKLAQETPSQRGELP